MWFSGVMACVSEVIEIRVKEVIGFTEDFVGLVNRLYGKWGYMVRGYRVILCFERLRLSFKVMCPLESC